MDPQAGNIAENGVLMFLLVVGIFLKPFIQPRPSSFQAEDAHPLCGPLLSDEIRSGSQNPFSRNWQMVGNTMGSQQDVAIWENPYLNSLSETGPGTDTDGYWILGKSPAWYRKLPIQHFHCFSAISLFSSPLPSISCRTAQTSSKQTLHRGCLVTHN